MISLMVSIYLLIYLEQITKMEFIWRVCTMSKRSKCKDMTKRYREILQQLLRLEHDAPEACNRLKDVAPHKYKDCMDSLKATKKSVHESRMNIRLQMQKYCKRSMAAQVTGSKYAPEGYEEGVRIISIFEALKE